jgi:uncharacterized protein (DUF1800 family)
MAVGYSAWIDEQFSRPASGYQQAFDQIEAAHMARHGSSSWEHGTISAWWKAALAGDDQLRQRVAFAWSQIMVISLQDSIVGGNPRAASAWLDMLSQKGVGNYRELLRAVSVHPLMGSYLSHLKNQKADPRTGRVPDENYAREVMQLFSIGLHELNRDGSKKLNAGQPIDTYGAKDIAGLARVFTGFGWNCADRSDPCFYNGSPDWQWKPNWQDEMVGYTKFHSEEEKSFLGTTIAAKVAADPMADLTQALDTLAQHPNVGPFIGKQLIQRLVTSNPSPAYVTAVSNAFENNGAGVRGDLKAVIKAVLMHPEARQVSDTSGKVREPLLRMTAMLRAFNFKSSSGYYVVGRTDNPGTSIGQAPLYAPSVFNYFRPGYVAPGSVSAGRQLVAPELQILHETSAAGYVNTVRDAVDWGLGWDTLSSTGRAEMTMDFTPLIAMWDQPETLVDHVADKLMHEPLPADLRTLIVNAVKTVQVPTPSANAGAGELDWIKQLKQRRAKVAILLIMASPEFQVQR